MYNLTCLKSIQRRCQETWSTLCAKVQPLITRIQSIAHDILVKMKLRTPTKDTSVEDTSLLTIDKQLEWRKDRFLKRTPLPQLTTEQRAQVESQHLADVPRVQQAIREEIAASQLEIKPEEQEEIVRHITQHYLMSKQYYAPAVMIWMDLLLQHADGCGKKLVFLARDGIVLNDVAKALLQKEKSQKYGQMSEEKMAVAWISRKSAQDASSKGDLLQRYFKQLGISETDELIMVDTGCTGSMKQRVAPLLKNKLDWMFSVSRNPAIPGFWDHADFSIQALAFIILPPEHPDAWANDPKHANTWVEDSHQGNLVSAKEFIDDKEHGIIYPSPSFTMVKDHLHRNRKERTDAETLMQELAKDFGYRAILDLTQETTVEDLKLDYDTAKKRLNDLLTRIQKGEVDVTPFIQKS